mmetsp:Transcript_11200/g.29697  ORF Transcript_11200/g.29697 Transcript_11200/m.29697 type:complete len:206 (-) Transcript_11200:577-1194(-)
MRGRGRLASASAFVSTTTAAAAAAASTLVRRHLGIRKAMRQRNAKCRTRVSLPPPLRSCCCRIRTRNSDVCGGSHGSCRRPQLLAVCVPAGTRTATRRSLSRVVHAKPLHDGVERSGGISSRHSRCLAWCLLRRVCSGSRPCSASSGKAKLPLPRVKTVQHSYLLVEALDLALDSTFHLAVYAFSKHAYRELASSWERCALRACC